MFRLHIGIDRMIPEPDYDPYDNSPANYNNKPYNRRNNNNEMHNTADRLCMGNSILDKDGLAIPRKPANPCVESTERRDLHRELMFNQKMWLAYHFISMSLLKFFIIQLIITKITTKK